MSEVRYDPLTDAWVIMAPARESRPEELVEAQLPGPPVLPCPFCPGNEGQTPPPTLMISERGTNDADNWLVRVVPNKYAAVEALGKGDILPHSTQLLDDSATHELALFAAMLPGEMSASTPADNGLSRTTHAPDESSNTPPSRNAGSKQPTKARRRRTPYQDPSYFTPVGLSGGHEVIIESPLHVLSLSDLDLDQVVRVFESYRLRLAHWFAQPDIQYAIVFKNVGAPAGASLRHSHSQLIATSLLPPRVRSVGQRLAEHHTAHGECLACGMIASELRLRQRVVALTDHFVALCPFASRLPYSIRVLPREHHSDFHELARHELAEFAELVQQLVRLLEALHVPAAYNYIIQTRARDSVSTEAFHWHFELFPRLVKLAGFEWGSGSYINTVLPEAAASHLRNVLRRVRVGERRRSRQGAS